MLFMMTVTYPLTATQKVTEKYLELEKNPLPDFIETTGPFSTWGGDGTEAYTIYNIDGTRVDEGLWEILARAMGYYEVEGLKMKGTVLAPIAEYLERMGIG